MIIERIKSEGISHNSYLVGSSNDAIVIDPRRDCQVYADSAQQRGLKIKYIFETHRNEDYVAGSVELKNITGAEIYHGPGLSWNIGAGASPQGTLDCVSAWLADFREDLKRIDIPVLIMHGDADRIVPLASSGKRMPDFIKDSRLIVIKGAPHGMNWTHAEEVNRELLAFLGENK